MACFYKPGPAELAYYAARQRWREGGYPDDVDIVALFKAMIAERRELCKGQS